MSSLFIMGGGGDLLLRRRIMIEKRGLIYRRVEYIESSGSQFIDTGLPLHGSSTVRIKYRLSDVNKRFGLGSSYYNNQRCFRVRNGGRMGSDYARYFYNYGNQYDWNVETPFPNDVQLHELEMNPTGIIMDGVPVVQYESATFTSILNALLFASFDGDNYSYYSYRIFECKILNNGDPVRDYIPVRVGRTGYLLDMISGQLFGNTGTGEFVLGPDI